MSRLSEIDPEPRIGRLVVELAAERRYTDFFPLDDAADLERSPFFYPETADGGTGPYGQTMVDLSFRKYRHDPLVAYEFADVHLLGADGVVLVDGAVVADTLDWLAYWHAESNVAEVRRREFLRLRRPLPVRNVIDTGRHVIGFNGPWRNHGHWLPQCLPRLYAFTLLRRRFRDLRVALPPLPPGSAQARTLELLGIGPEAVTTVAPDAATCFASAILLPNFDVWNITNFVSAAADALIARQPPPGPDAAVRPDKVYVHRTVPARAVANFAQLRPVLDRYGFAVVSFEQMDFAEQVATMQAARTVVSEHGAGTANILFCRETTRVLELFSPYSVQPAFWTIASRRGLDYGYLIGTHAAGAGVRADWNTPYEIAPERLEEAIRAALRLPPRPAAAQAAAAPPPPPPPPPQAGPLAGPQVQAAPAVAAPAAAAPAAAPLPAAPAVAAVPGRRPSGIGEPTFDVVNNAARLGHGAGNERMPLFNPAVPPAQTPMLNEPQMPADFVDEHYYYPSPPTVAAYAVSKGELWGNGFVSQEGRFVLMPDCMPGYFRDHLRADSPPMPPGLGGALELADPPTLALDRPVAVATHPNLTYGAALLEVLPRLWLLARLRDYGADLKLMLSRTVPGWLLGFVELFHGEGDIQWYDGARQCVTAPALVMPAMLHTEYNFHPAMNLMVRELVQRLPPEPGSPVLVYLARAALGEERLENQAEAEQAMRALGFTVVRVEELTAAQQIRLFAGARMVVAEQGYALFGAMFSPPGTRVVAINFANHYQSAIARLRRHRIGYVPPVDGKFRHWRLTRGLSHTFAVDIGVLTRTVQQMAEAP